MYHYNSKTHHRLTLNKVDLVNIFMPFYCGDLEFILFFIWDLGRGRVFDCLFGLGGGIILFCCLEMVLVWVFCLSF